MRFNFTHSMSSVHLMIHRQKFYYLSCLFCPRTYPPSTKDYLYIPMLLTNSHSQHDEQAKTQDGSCKQ